jgi:hypothetical protein
MKHSRSEARLLFLWAPDETSGAHFVTCGRGISAGHQQRIEPLYKFGG